MILSTRQSVNCSHRPAHGTSRHRGRTEAREHLTPKQSEVKAPHARGSPDVNVTIPLHPHAFPRTRRITAFRRRLSKTIPDVAPASAGFPGLHTKGASLRLLPPQAAFHPQSDAGYITRARCPCASSVPPHHRCGFSITPPAHAGFHHGKCSGSSESTRFPRTRRIPPCQKNGIRQQTKLSPHTQVSTSSTVP